MKKKLIIIASILFVMFIINSWFVMSGASVSFDNSLYAFIKSFQCDFLDNYFLFVTKFGNPIVVVSIVLIFLVFNRNSRGLILTGMGILSFSTNTLFKYIFRRDRPSVLKMITQGGYSYPSGHAMISVSIYGYLLYLVNKCIMNKWLKIILNILLVLLILSVGVSRIYLGVHYASDIVGGFLLALVELILFINISNKAFRGN